MKKQTILLITVLLLGLMLAACGAQSQEAAAPTDAPVVEAPVATEAPSMQPVTLTYLVDDGKTSQLIAHTLADAYMAAHPNVTIEIENKPGGADGDNVVKTRLATGEMPDLFNYNAGSLLQALNPSDTLVDLTNEPFMDNVDRVRSSRLSRRTEKSLAHRVRQQWAGVSSITRKVYEELGLSVPMTWEEFAANNEIIKEAGIAPVIATFGDSWTSQLFVLADYYNVQTAIPELLPRITLPTKPSMPPPQRRWQDSDICRKASRRVGIRKILRLLNLKKG